ncbi:hypothetical protein [Paenibacillus foliorum]|nr:hypothetical protein [Paenibacillus foliorum]
MRMKRKSQSKMHDYAVQYVIGVATGLTVGLLLIFIQRLWH